MRVFADAEWHNISTPDAAARLASMPWSGAVDFIGCDPAGDAVNLQTGTEDVRVLRAAFPSARVAFSTAPTHRSPEWRASKIRDLLWSASGSARLVCDPAARCTIRALEASVYPKLRPGSGEKAEPVKDGVIDHTRDALGYLVVNRLFGRTPEFKRRPW